MKRITLNSLTMTNFKGEKERTTVFNDGQTFIYGANGTGKSRHYDAFLWLLFGKDAQDRQDYEIKTVVNGEPLHKVDSSVRGEFTVDGEKLTLKRTLVEDWVKPRGQSEQVFKGNHTDYEWNGVPVSATEYKQKVRDIIDDSAFKMLSNPEYFASLPWQNQRDILFSMADVPDDIEVAKSDKSLSSLINKITGKSVQDYRNELLANKKRLNQELSGIQPRIDQTVKMIPEADDFSAIEKRMSEIDLAKEGINTLMSDRRKSVADLEKKQKEITDEISSIYARQQQIESGVKEKAMSEYNAAYSHKIKVKSQLAEAKSRLSSMEFELSTVVDGLKSRKSTLAEMRSEIEAIRKEYTDEYAVSFSGSTVCPYCGSDLPDKMIDELKQKFASEKKSRLDAITARGKSKGESISRIEAEIEAGGKRIAELEAGILEARKNVETLEEVFAKIPEPQMPEIRFEDNAEWSGLEERKARLRESMPDASVDLSDLQEKLAGLDKERLSLVERMSKRPIIERFNKEVESLNARGRDLSQMIADIEKEESLITALTRKKIEICEGRVNSMFSLVRFRLYTYTNEGNPVETCIPLVDGVPYGTANTARRINAGLDIINALQKHFDTSVPVFLDNRERVNEVLPIDAQTVHMFVTNDKELIIK